MRRTKLILSFVLIFCICLTGCSDISSVEVEETSNTVKVVETQVTTTSHTHKFADATCIEAKKCKICGETVGEALGHNWEDATCNSPKKCSVCDATEGKSLEHKWEEATCKSPKKCTECGATKGESLDHNWKGATCESPAKCTECGKTKGEALGHSWKDATCDDPKTCTTCGTTDGYASGHSFSSGKCSWCGDSDPNYVSEVMVWVPTNGGKKYHTNSGCSNMIDPMYVTKSEAISMGFDACKRCYR